MRLSCEENWSKKNCYLDVWMMARFCLFSKPGRLPPPPIPQSLVADFYIIWVSMKLRHPPLNPVKALKIEICDGTLHRKIFIFSILMFDRIDYYLPSWDKIIDAPKQMEEYFREFLNSHYLFLNSSWILKFMYYNFLY